MKKLIKVLCILAIVFVVALIVAFIAIKQAFPPEKIKAMVEKEATDILKREVSVGGAGFKLWPLGIQVKDIKVANNPGRGFSEDPLFDLPLAGVKIDLLKLLIMQVAIDKISIENMTLLYEVMPDGRTSLDGLGGESDTTKKDTAKLDLSKIELPGSLALNSFQIKNAKVIYNDRSQKRNIILGSINLNTKLSLDKTLENIKTSTKLALNEISLEDAGIGVRKGGIKVFLNADINANLRKQHINIQKLSTGMQSVSIDASGTIDRFMEEVMVVDLMVESNQIDLATLLKEVPADINPELPKVKASGTAYFNAVIKGAIVPEKIPNANGSIVLSKIALSHSDLPSGISDLTGNIIFTENAVSIKPLTFNLAGQPTSILLDASDLLSPKPMLNNLSVNAKLDLGTLFTLANKIVNIQELSSLTGRIEANLGAKGVLDPARPENISVNGNVNMQNIVAKTPLIPDAISANGTVRFSNTEIDVAPSVRIGPSDVRVKATVRDYLAMVMPRLAAGKKTNIKVDINSSNLNLDRLLPPSDQTAPPKKDDPPPMEIYPELPDVVADINVNLANTVFRYLTLSNFNLGINFANKKAAVVGSGQLYTGGFNTNVAVDLNNRKSADVKFALNVDRVEANDFISNGRKNISGDSEMAKQIRNLDNTIFGKLTMKIDVRTKGLPHEFIDNLSGPISMQVTNGRLQGSKILGSIGGSLAKFEIAGKKAFGKTPISEKGDMQMDDLRADFEAKSGQLLVKNLNINASSLGLLAFTGGVGFNGNLNLNLQNTLSSSISSNLNNLTKASPVSLYQKDARGNAILFFNIGGTFASPNVTMDASKNANPVADLKNMATARLNEEKAKLEAQALAKKKELEDKAKAEVAAKKKEAESQAKAKVADVAKDKGKNLLKKF